MIEVKNLSFGYHSTNNVFENLNIHFKPGCIYGLLGENGVGKTTLLRLLAGLLFPKDGELKVLEFRPFQRRPDFLSEIYYLPDMIDVPKMSIKNYVDLYAPFYPRFSHDKLYRFLEEFGVNEKQPMHKMSFGQQKKAMLSFALACNTTLLLLDEPTNGMDIPSKSIFRKLLASNSTAENCVIISTHQVKDLENMIDPILILEPRQILLNNSVEEISQKLWFGEVKELPENILYKEESLGGYYIVKPREEESLSKVNIEALFNAAILNKTWFKHHFLE